MIKQIKNAKPLIKHCKINTNAKASPADLLEKNKKWTRIEECPTKLLPIIFGNILGGQTPRTDPRRQAHKKTVIKFDYGKKDSEYLFHVRDKYIEYGFCSIKNIRDLRKSRAIFETHSFACFNDLLTMFFRPATKEELKRNSRKPRIRIVPKKITNILNEEVLAYWFMESGSYNGSRGVYMLRTRIFQPEDVKRLQKALKKKLGLSFNIFEKAEKLHYLEIKAESKEGALFIKKVDPFLIPWKRVALKTYLGADFKEG